MAKKVKKQNWLRQSTRIVGMDPVTFEEWWRFKMNRLQFLSLFLLFAVLLFIFNYLIFAYTPVGHLLPENIKNRNKQKIEATAMRLATLEKRLAAQDKYITNLQMVILGEDSADSIFITEDVQLPVEQPMVDTTTSEAEKALVAQIKANSEKIKQGSTRLADNLLLYDPVIGEISKNFKLPNHPGVDIVTIKDAQIKACLDGVVMHSSFSDLDGHTIIIRHKNDIISIYKHAKTIYPKVGEMVKTGDAIGVVGSTGERSSGPHLHFELWSDSGPLDPMKYFSFGK